MKKVIKSIHLTFENCEGADADGSEIHEIYVGKCTLKSDYFLADDIWIKFKDLKNLKYDSFSTLNKDLFTRIKKFNDITQIEICYNDDNRIKFVPAWKDNKNPYENKFQRLTKGKDGLWRVRIFDKEKAFTCKKCKENELNIIDDVYGSVCPTCANK